MEYAKLKVRSIAFASAVTWGSAVLIMGAANRWISPEYGRAFLELASSVYPGYHAMTGGKSVFIGFGYALLDGFICGAIFAWLYNLCAGRCCKS